MTDMEGKELIASSMVPPNYSSEEWKRLSKEQREIESSSYLARLKAEAKKKLAEKDGSTHTDPPTASASTSSAGAALPAMTHQKPANPSDKTRCERAWATGNTWERETNKDLQKMNTALKKDTEFHSPVSYTHLTLPTILLV